MRPPHQDPPLLCAPNKSYSVSHVAWMPVENDESSCQNSSVFSLKLRYFYKFFHICAKIWRVSVKIANFLQFVGQFRLRDPTNYESSYIST